MIQKKLTDEIELPRRTRELTQSKLRPHLFNENRANWRIIWRYTLKVVALAYDDTYPQYPAESSAEWAGCVHIENGDTHDAVFESQLSLASIGASLPFFNKLLG
jgi:hypothetical protein